MVQPPPVGALRLLAKFGETMLEISRMETVYNADLKGISREFGVLYFKWTADLAVGKDISSLCEVELQRIRFSAHKRLCEELLKRGSELAGSLDKLFFVDTKALKIAVMEATTGMQKAESLFEEGKNQEGIRAIKSAVDSVFEVYNSWRAVRKDHERSALRKMGAVVAGIYFPAMVVYFAILTFMKIEPNWVFGVVVPLFSAIFAIVPFIALFPSAEEDSS